MAESINDKVNDKTSEKNILSIAICDDEPLAVDYVAHHLQNWAQKHQCILRISRFSSAEEFLFSYEEDQDFDVLFLDIQMEKMNGVELARTIREKDVSVQIVFITAIADYISEGYELSALHYLMKPVSEEKLFAVMDRAVKNCVKSENYLLVTSDQTLKRISVNSILYAETFAHYIVLVTAEGEYQIRENTGAFAEKLGKDFVRPHRSYLVNLRHVHSISKTEVLLDNGKAIPLSRYNYQKINQAFIQYYKGMFNDEAF